MTTGLTGRIRFVKCPRCRRILPELPDIPVYKCGGCDTILIAKNRKNDASASNVDLSLQNTDSIQGHELDHPSADKEPGVSSHEAVIPPSGVSNFGRNDDEDQKESGECSSEELVRINARERQENLKNNDGSCAYHGGQPEPGSPNQVCSAVEFSHHENDELLDRDLAEAEEASISSSHEATIPSSGECIIDPNDEKDQEEFGDSSSEQLVRIKSSERQDNTRSYDESCAFHDEQPGCSNQFYSTIDFDHHENGEFSGRDPIEAEEAIVSRQEVMTIPSSGECILDPNDEKDEKETDDSNSEQLIRIISSEHQKGADNDDDSRACYGEQSGLSNQVFSPDEFGNNENEEEISSRDHSEDEITDEILLSKEGNPEGDDSKKINSNLESSAILNQVAASSSVITADTQVGASISSKPLAPLEQVEEPEETINCSFEHRSRPEDNFESLELNQVSEPSGALLDMAKSPTNSYLAYYSSVSTFDEMEDQFLNNRTHSLNNIHRAANFQSPGESPRKEKSRMYTSVARDSEVPYKARSSQIKLSEEKHYAVEYRKRNQDDLLQHGRHDFSMKNRNRLRREKYQTKASLIGRDHLGGYDSGCTSDSMFNEFYDSKIHSSANVIDNDQDKVRLLRMVYELQDQLERSCNLGNASSGRVSMGSTEDNPWMPMYQNQRIPREESWRDSEHLRYPVRSRLETYYPRQHSLSRMASSGKATGVPPANRSMQLLPSSPMVHPNHDYYNPYDSCPSSPQHYPFSSQLSARGSRLKYENLRHQNHEMNHLREKNHVAKHHLRPMAGGAPFITCYHCLKLLQIPTEFLLLKRRCNRLKCGNCSKVLEFSLESRTHIVPYVPTLIAADPPPSATDEHNGMSHMSTSLASEYHAGGSSIKDPVSSSVDYSMEGNHSTLQQHPSRRDMDKDATLNRFQSKSMNPEKRYQARGGPSRHAYKADKFSSEMEKLPAMSNSPLHQLMGYSSPSLVIRGLNSSGRSMQKKY